MGHIKSEGEPLPPSGAGVPGPLCGVGLGLTPAWPLAAKVTLALFDLAALFDMQSAAVTLPASSPFPFMKYLLCCVSIAV